MPCLFAGFRPTGALVPQPSALVLAALQCHVAKMTQGCPTMRPIAPPSCHPSMPFFFRPRTSGPPVSKVAPPKLQHSTLKFTRPSTPLPFQNIPVSHGRHVFTTNRIGLPSVFLHSSCRPSLRLPLSQSGMRILPLCPRRLCWSSLSMLPGPHHAPKWPLSSPPLHQNIPSQSP
jgi:hypothetical protein